MKCDQLRTELKKRNQRMTAQRDIVLKSFIEAETDHLSADEAYRKVMEKNCRISKATVYRTVELLAGLGLLRRIVFRDGIIRYELVKKGEHHHHHVVCNRCGSVVEFPLDNLDDLEELVREKTGYTIEDHQLKFYGFCPKCQSEKKTQNNRDSETK